MTDSKKFHAEGGTRTRTPRGATPSRWCVCQFHHFGEVFISFPASLAGPVRSFERELEAAVPRVAAGPAALAGPAAQAGPAAVAAEAHSVVWRLRESRTNRRV